MKHPEMHKKVKVGQTTGGQPTGQMSLQSDKWSRDKRSEHVTSNIELTGFDNFIRLISREIAPSVADLAQNLGSHDVSLHNAGTSMNLACDQNRRETSH